MKKIIALFAAAVMSTAAVFADFSAGARAGAGINIFEFDDADLESNVKCGFTAAVFADIDIPAVDGLVFQPEVVFTKHVFGYDIVDTGVTFEIEVSANTLEFPLLLGYKIKAGESFTIMPFAGPRVSFNLGDIKMKSMGMSQSLELDNVVNFGITAGCSAFLNVGPGSFVFDVRYNRDFTSLESETEIGVYQSIDISAGYTIKL